MPLAGLRSSTPTLAELAVQTVARAASVAVASVGRSNSKRRDKSVRAANTTPLASTRAKHIRADDQLTTAADSVNQQQVPSVLAVQHAVESAVEATSRVETSSKRQNDTLSPLVAPQAFYVSAASRNFNEKMKDQHLSSCDADQETRFDAFQMLSTHPQLVRILDIQPL